MPLPQVRLVAFYGAWILPDQIGCDGLMDMALRRMRPIEGLAQADHAFVGVDEHPQDVGE